MKVWLGKDTQTKLAELGLFIPAVKGTAAVIQDSLMSNPALTLDNATRHRIPRGTFSSYPDCPVPQTVSMPAWV
jgi:hypothetical protein